MYKDTELLIALDFVSTSCYILSLDSNTHHAAFPMQTAWQKCLSTYVHIRNYIYSITNTQYVVHNNSVYRYLSYTQHSEFTTENKQYIYICTYVHTYVPVRF